MKRKKKKKKGGQEERASGPANKEARRASKRPREARGRERGSNMSIRAESRRSLPSPLLRLLHGVSYTLAHTPVSERYTLRSVVTLKQYRVRRPLHLLQTRESTTQEEAGRR